MPYLNVRIAMNESSSVSEKIVTTLMKHTSELLGKKSEVTSIAVDFVAPNLWFVGGARMSDQNAVTCYLDIKVTDGTLNSVQFLDDVYDQNIQSLLGTTLTAANNPTDWKSLLDNRTQKIYE